MDKGLELAIRRVARDSDRQAARINLAYWITITVSLIAALGLVLL